MSVRSRAGAPVLTMKAFGGNEPPGMAQAAAEVSQMTMDHAFAPGEPVGPYDGYSRTPRGFDYVTGYNIATRPRTHERVSFDTLRGLIESYDVAEICIWHRIDSIRGLDWQLVAADGYTGDVTQGAAFGKQALAKPDGRNSFSTWLAKWLYDVLAYDAGALYRLRNRAGRVIGLQPVDGSTIAPLLDYWGNSPWDPLSPPDEQPEAYVQYVNGLPWNWLTRSDLIYEPFRPRTNSPYGRAPIESILLNANTDIRFQLYFLQHFTQGNVPEAFASAPETWDPAQIEQFQALWDAMLYGDQSRKHQIRWMPGGAKIAWSNEKDFTDDFSLFLMRKTCLDEQTEILTRRGWVHFPKLIDSDEVATRSADGQFEWQKPTDYIAEPHSGDMVQFKSNSLDLLVTPEHRMLLTYFPTKKHPQPKEFIRTAGEIVGKGGYMIPMRSRWEGPSPENFVLPGLSYDVPNRGGMSHHTVVRPDVVIPMRIWAAFLGLFLAEGHVGGSKGGKRLQGDGRNRTYKVGISQSPASPYFGEMQELLDSMPFRWIRTDHGWECQDKRLHTYLAPLGNSHTKYIPQDAKDLSPELLEIMWAWACKGDGHHYLGKSWHMITASERLADDWQEILQKCGRDASVSPRKPGNGGVVRGRPVTNCKPTWLVRERTSPLRTAHGEIVQYEGMVYCVTVPNGVIYVRRNGRPAWVGNCACFHVVPSDLGFTETVNLASSESQVDVQHRVGELPLDDYIENLITAFLQDDLGLPVAFQFDKGEEQEDQYAQAQSDQIYIQNGSVSASEIREMRFGLAEPVGQVVPRFIMTSRSGPVPLASLMGVAGKVDPATGAPVPGTELPHMAFTEVPGVVPNPPLEQPPLAEQEFGPKAIPPAPPDQAIALPKATDAAHQVAKEGEGAPTAGVTSETGLYSYDLDKGDDDEREAAVAKELAAFRRFSRSRQRAGTWRDFRFGRVAAGTARALNDEGRAAVTKAASGYDLSPRAGMISLDLPEGLIEAVPGGVDDFHVTVVFLGQDVDDGLLANVCQRAAAAAAAMPGPLDATVTGVGSFPPSDGSDGKVPAWAAVLLPDCATQLRDGLADLSASEHADWHPHMTLAYLDDGDPLPDPLPPTPVTFTHLSVHRGGQVVQRFPLGGEDVAKAADAGPKVPWPGWDLNKRTVAYWAPLLAAAAGKSLPASQAKTLAVQWLAENPEPVPAGGKREANSAAAGWLTSHGVTFDLAGVAAGIAADGYVIGASSASLLTGGSADTDGWQPGDTKDAEAQVAAAGLAVSGADVAGMQAAYLDAAARSLTDSQGTDTDPAAAGQALADAVADPGLAQNVVLNQVVSASAQAAEGVYQSQGIEQVDILNGPNPCPTCAELAATNPHSPGLVPVHDFCQCSEAPHV